MFKFAIDMEIVTTNFAALVELPTGEASELHKPFTREELSGLWSRTGRVDSVLHGIKTDETRAD